MYMANPNLVKLCESQSFNNYVLILIMINAAILGILTFDFSQRTILFLEALDLIILLVFAFEMLVKILAYGKSFFDSNWNVFDLTIVILAVIPAVSSISVLRVFRVFKVLRLITVFPELRRMVEATSRSIRSIFAISMLLGIVVYVFAVMSHMLFGNDGATGSEYFSNLGESIFSLFQIMTLDAWADGMVRELMTEHGGWVAIYFGFFILSTTFTFLNMFIAVFTNTMASIDIEDGDDVGFSRIINDLKFEIDEMRTSYNLYLKKRFNSDEEE